MGSLTAVTTDLQLESDAASEWTTDFPYANTSFPTRLLEFPFMVLNNASMYPHPPHGCPSLNNVGRYISMVLYIVVCVIGLFGNSLVI